MVNIGMILDAESKKPLNPNEWGKYVKVFHVDLAPGEEKALADIPAEFVEAYKDRDGVILEVCYTNPLEPEPISRSTVLMHLKYLSDGWHAMVFEIYEEPSGILTKVPNMFRDIHAHLRLRQYLKSKEACPSHD
jgi:hypothetical protein